MDRNQILALLRERIVAYAASRLQRDIAEDLAQEVLMVLEQKYRQVDAMEELTALSFRILRFKMLGLERRWARRGERKQVSVDDLPLADPAENPEAAVQRRQMLQRLKAALGKLGGRCRELFRLKLEGKTFLEIRGILGAGSLSTVYTWDHRCRKQLLKLMGGTWETRR